VERRLRFLATAGDACKHSGRRGRIPSVAGGHLEDRANKTRGADPVMNIESLVQATLHESYLDRIEDLRAYADKVRHFNSQKKAVREYLAALRKFKAEVISAARKLGIDLCRGEKRDEASLAKLFKERAHPYKVGDCAYELCISNRVPPLGTDSLALLDSEIARWDLRLATMQDDAQLVSIELQDMLQKHQQYLQLLSNISKATHDTAMAIIRNIKG
jgi:hypothetical protein